MPVPAAYNSQTAPETGSSRSPQGVADDAHDDRLEAEDVAQRPPVFPSPQDQRSAEDDDERYFADLRAMPDEEDSFARPRRDDSWNRHPSGGWETTEPVDDFDAVRPRTDEFDSVRPRSDASEYSDPTGMYSEVRPPSDEFASIRPRSDEFETVRPRGDDFEPMRPRGDEFEAARPRRDDYDTGSYERRRPEPRREDTGSFEARREESGSFRARREDTGSFEVRRDAGAYDALRPDSGQFSAVQLDEPRPRRRDDDAERSRPAADPWGDDPGARLDDAYAVPDIDDQPAPAGWADPQDPYFDDPYRRSDIVQESQTDPSGWKASGPAQPPIPDDRPPAEALSGNRLLTILLFFSGLATTVSLWLFDTPGGSVNDAATTMLAAGRITGLVSGYILFIQLLMMSRVSWLEEWVGARDLLRWHRWLGTSLVVGVLGHIVLIVYGYALTAESGVVSQGWMIITTFPKMMNAVIATGILVVISLTSIRFARSRLPYEFWHLLHFAGYLVLLLGYGHQVATGADLSGRFSSVFWPGLSALVISALVWGRLIEPLWLNSRHRFEVAEVVTEGTNTFSIYIDGKKLDKLPAQAGQFMRWRFLTRNGWWQSHPFSLSAAPNKEWLRLTVTAVGGHTARLADMKPRTPVWAAGPFGVFTAQRRTRRRALLIAGGSGIAPIRALLEDMPPDTIVIYRASRPDELVFRGELEELAERRDAWVRYIVGSRNDPGPRRLFTPPGLLGLVPDVSRRDVYLCGPPGLVGAAVGTLRELDVPESQLHLDPFEF
ncbi:ferric reductase-like transmembrane domain-containing protein [Actinoplanes sp. NPDC051411]|uniref:ferredoxin reductase family protein n=1 Tax=Actinoplanes sp. NPDC051411 TaxID=3155522 RepID=UPI0034258B6B